MEATLHKLHGDLAIVPAMVRLPATEVRAPVLTDPVRTGTGVELQGSDAAPPTRRATSFAVYRVDGTADAIDVEDVATLRAQAGVVQRWTDATAQDGRASAYAVTALDRVWNESAPSAVRAVG